MLLFAACSGGGGNNRDDGTGPLEQFQLADWAMIADVGAEMPRADAGRVRLESTGEGGQRTRAGIRSRAQGRFTDFRASIVLSRPNSAAKPADYDAFVSIDIDGTTASENGNEVARQARIGLRASNSNVSLVTQLLDSDGNPVEQSSRTLGSLDADDGIDLLDRPVPLRIEVDERQQVVRFFAEGSLERLYVPTTLSLPGNSTIGIEASGREFLVFADDLFAIDEAPTGPSFTFRKSAAGPVVQTPGRVQFLFTLRDQHDDIIDLDASQLVGSNLYFMEKGVEIDRSEANPIFKKARVPQDVVVLLDYTESMRASGGIPAMVQGAKDLAVGVWQANARSRVQFWEFHDSFTAAAVMVPQLPPGAQGNWLDAGKQTEAFQALDGFAPYYGFSRVFDAVLAASSSFDEDPRGSLQSLVFLTDGIDTGSSVTVDGLIANANGDNYALYPLAIGAPDPQARQLRRIAAQTAGGVYGVAGVADLVNAFRELGGDLGSLYSASYTSSVPNDFPLEEVELDISLRLGSPPQPTRLAVPVTETLQIVTGDTRVGLLDFEQVSFSGSTAVFRAEALFVPRDVGTFSIGGFMPSGLPPEATVTTRVVNGGLLDQWSAFSRTMGVDAASGPALRFGDFGDFIEVQVDGVPLAVNSFTLQAKIVNTGLTPRSFRTINAGSTVENVNWQFTLSAAR
ncbi:MAG TPA: vWA domain-containing protein [Planctomycetota bacterium]|nr:vWA domain-containing protein [Planctomycetota bacterium]